MYPVRLWSTLISALYYNTASIYRVSARLCHLEMAHRRVQRCYINIRDVVRGTRTKFHSETCLCITRHIRYFRNSDEHYLPRVPLNHGTLHLPAVIAIARQSRGIKLQSTWPNYASRKRLLCGRSKFRSGANWNFLAHWHGNTFPDTLHASAPTQTRQELVWRTYTRASGTQCAGGEQTVPTRRSLESV